MSRPFVKFAAGLAAVALPLSAVTAMAGAASQGKGAALGAINKQTAIANEVPSDIKTKGKLTVASDATYAPMEYLDTDNTTVIGLDADLAKAVGKVLGLSVQIDNVTFDSIIPKLQSNTYNLGFSSFTDTKVRERTVNFVDYFSAGESFYIKKGHKALSGSGLTQMCGLKVAVEAGTTEEADATSAIAACTKIHKAGPTVRSFNDQSTANLAVSSGQADVGFVDQPIAGYIVSNSGGVFVNSGKPFAAAPYGIAVGKTYSGLDKAVLDAMKYLVTKGYYASILKYWGQSTGAVKTITENKAIF
jgi:polar amino acid transport system substrate-binding protein